MNSNQNKITDLQSHKKQWEEGGFKTEVLVRDNKQVLRVYYKAWLSDEILSTDTFFDMNDNLIPTEVILDLR